MKAMSIGVVMGAVMLTVMHRPIMDGTLSAGGISVAFIAGHVAVAGVLLALAAYVPWIGTRLRHHRPSLRHAGQMVLGMVMLVALVHLSAHGVA